MKLVCKTCRTQKELKPSRIGREYWKYSNRVPKCVHSWVNPADLIKEITGDHS